MKLKKKNKEKFLFCLLIIIVLSLISAYLLIKLFNNRVIPVLLNYAESETRKITTLVINNAVTKQMANNLEDDELFTIHKDADGEINLITYNSVNVTRMLSTITNLIQLNLKSIEEGNVDLVELPNNGFDNYDKKILNKGIIYEVPAFSITGNAFLSNLGPLIPIKLSLVGDVVSNIESKVTEYGINNALLEVGIYVEVRARINLPFVSKIVKISNVIPISMKVIEGRVPSTYLNGSNKYFGNDN